MTNKEKQKRRLKKAIKQREKENEKKALDLAWRNYWVKVGILNEKVSL
ncbi:DUF3983 domain-containing protein [Bacillus sp. UNC438CL73TsuS30]|nr:DUF3983 domain-containing protein [Bacillus sp. UNC438CL73TsuS30]